MAASPSLKRGTDESGAFRIKKLTVHAGCPSRTLRACSSPKQKTQRSCVIRCQITRTRIHTSLKRLASACHNNGSKSFLPVECMLQTKQSLKTKKMDDVFPGAPLYSGRVGSDIIGCCQPTSGVFVCMLQTRIALTAFPHSDP